MREVIYKYENENIKISMEIYFNDNGQLIFDGYDIGKTVKDAFGDSDYEYYYTIEPSEIQKLALSLDLEDVNKGGILKAIKTKFSGNYAYSQFGDFLTKNNIKYEAFTWR